MEELFDADPVDAACADLAALADGEGWDRVDKLQRTPLPGVSATGDVAKLPAVPEATSLVALGTGDGVRGAVGGGRPVPLRPGRCVPLLN